MELEGFGMVRERREVEELGQEGWREMAMGLLERKGEGEEGGELFEVRPKSFLALRITEWTSVSGPKASLIISFSPWSWIRRRPMILEAFSGSMLWILENTTLVAS